MFTLTVMPYQGVLRARARQLAGNETDADDLVQATLERALRTFSSFRPGTAAQAWLLTILRSVWIDNWRRTRRDVPEPLGGLCAVQPEPDPPDLYDLADVIAARVPTATQQLPPKLRTVLELRLISKFTYRAIAQHLRLSLPTVGTRLLRAKRRLARILEADLRLQRDQTRSVARLPVVPGEGLWQRLG
jgi:RNA polymerase sigma-70 factor (ECF subfamily)